MMKLPGQKGTAFFLVLTLTVGSTAYGSRPAAPRQRGAPAKKVVKKDEPAYRVDDVVQELLDEGAICPIDGPGCTMPTDSRRFRYRRDGHYLRVAKKPGCQKQCEACSVVPKLIMKKCKGAHCQRTAERARAHCEQRYCKWMPPHLHDGADVGFGMGGSLVRNAIGGRVVLVRRYNDSSTGKLVVVERTHKGRPITMWYMHLSRIASGIQEGVTLLTGDPIGKIGDSGTWGGAPHLHFSIRGALDSKVYHDPTVIVVKGSHFMRFDEHEVQMAPDPVEPIATSEDELLAVAEKMGYMNFTVEEVESYTPPVDVTITAKPETRRVGDAVVVIHDPEHMVQPMFR